MRHSTDHATMLNTPEIKLKPSTEHTKRTTVVCEQRHSFGKELPALEPFCKYPQMIRLQ